jgi:hypothetical protein
MESVLKAGVLLFGLGLGQLAQAGTDPTECSMAKWDGGDSPQLPSDAVGSPFSSPEIARYSEFCGLVVSAAGYVQTPATSDSHYFGRFFVLPQVTGSGEVDLLEAYADTGGSQPLFTISYDGTDFIFDATAAGGGTGSAPAHFTPGSAPKWNLVEFEFNSGSTFNVWVNESWTLPDGPYTSGPSDSFTSGSGTVASVRLGAIGGMGGFGGTITYDAYEAHRTTNVGALRRGDANSDGFVNSGDIGQVINEFFDVSLANGTPDCNQDGFVNTGDIGCIINIFFGAPN